MKIMVQNKYTINLIHIWTAMSCGVNPQINKLISKKYLVSQFPTATVKKITVLAEFIYHYGL